MADDTGLSRVEFKVQTPGDESDLIARMARNEARSLQEAVPLKTCIIVGSGPSARHDALWKRLKADPDITTVAVNGALSLFNEKAISPTYWTCCDPQEDQVMRFVTGFLPRFTTYLVATKCPEALFNRLESKRLKVRKWRLDDYTRTPNQLHVPTAVSITLVTQQLMRFMGYHRFEMYGWDCCYLDGQHHADNASEDHNQPITYTMLKPGVDPEKTGYTPEDIQAEFQTAGPWMAEISDAEKVAYNHKVMGYETVVHGPGAVAAHLRMGGLLAE